MGNIWWQSGSITCHCCYALELVPGNRDGVTEAAIDTGEEFGECRLLDTLKSHSHLAVRPLVQAVVGAVQQFTDGEQEDDITLVIARSLP